MLGDVRVVIMSTTTLSFCWIRSCARRTQGEIVVIVVDYLPSHPGDLVPSICSTSFNLLRRSTLSSKTMQFFRCSSAGRTIPVVDDRDGAHCHRLDSVVAHRHHKAWRTQKKSLVASVWSHRVWSMRIGSIHDQAFIDVPARHAPLRFASS